MLRFIPCAILKTLAVAALLQASASALAGAAPLPVLVPSADLTEVVDILVKQHGEQRRGLGLTLGGQVLEIFVHKRALVGVSVSH
jgi:hypothetical protein